MRTTRLPFADWKECQPWRPERERRRQWRRLIGYVFALSAAWTMLAALTVLAMW